MKQTLKFLSIDIKRAFCSIGFLISVIGIWLVYYVGARSEISYASDVLLLFKYSTGASGFNKIIILFCALPYTTSFCVDWNSKYIRSISIRMGSKKNYAICKIIACALSSGIAVALGLILFIVPLTFKIPLVSTTGGNFEAFATQTLGGELLVKGHYVMYFAIYIYLAFLSGAFWSLVGLWISAYIPNKFVALFMPFITLYVFNLMTRSFPLCLQFNKVTNGDCLIGGTFMSLIYATVLAITFIIVVGSFFIKATERRLSNE